MCCFVMGSDGKVRKLDDCSRSCPYSVSYVPLTPDDVKDMEKKKEELKKESKWEANKQEKEEKK